jgi:putative membrane protein insertion efficiency factor
VSILARALVALIGLYRRFLSPMLPRSCRFEPTCSEYARQAIATHGAMRGTVLALRRIARCHPWNPGGIDRVPTRKAAH